MKIRVSKRLRRAGASTIAAEVALIAVVLAVVPFIAGYLQQQSATLGTAVPLALTEGSIKVFNTPTGKLAYYTYIEIKNTGESPVTIVKAELMTSSGSVYDVTSNVNGTTILPRSSTIIEIPPTQQPAGFRVQPGEKVVLRLLVDVNGQRKVWTAVVPVELA